jgi:hypothetical protein
MRLGGDLGLSLELTADLGAGQDVLTVLVELELVDDDVGRVNAQGNGLAGGLVAGDTLDVDDVLETVDGGDLALAALVGATDDGDLVVLADGDGADLLGSIVRKTGWLATLSWRVAMGGKTYVVLLTELLGEGSAHDGTALGGVSLVVSGTALATRGRNHWNIC